MHWDGFDNLLVQLRGRKRVLLLPPEAVAALGFRVYRYHSWLLGAAEMKDVGVCAEINH